MWAEVPALKSTIPPSDDSMCTHAERAAPLGRFTPRCFCVAARIALLTLPMFAALRRAEADNAFVYSCRAIAGGLRVDGRLDEPQWAAAMPLAITNIYKPAHADYRAPSTEVRFLWDATNLYVAFTCQDDDIWSFSDRPDDTLWLGDAVELFIRPSRESGEYAEFVVAPNGTLADARYPSRGAGGFHRFKTWTSGARIAVSAEGTENEWRDEDVGFTVEMAIPWTAFDREAPRANDEEWTFGAFRCDYSKSRADPLLIMSLPRAGGWGFHDYDQYHPIRFTAGPE